MPDKVLNFVKDHFLMDGVIRSQPLLLKRNVRYTQIAVDRVQLGKKAYHVLFIGTGKELRNHTKLSHLQIMNLSFWMTFFSTFCIQCNSLQKACRLFSVIAK